MRSVGGPFVHGAGRSAVYTEPPPEGCQDRQGRWLVVIPGAFGAGSPPASPTFGGAP